MSDRLAADQTPFVAVGDTVLHVERRGGPDAPVIVFANSLGSDARIWRDVLARLPERYATLAYDLRGHGLSDCPGGSCSIADHARDLLGIVDHFGIRRFALVGLSVGGMIVQTIAAEHPERVAALVLCATGAKIGDVASWDARIAAVEREGLASIADGVLERWFTDAYRSGAPVAMRGWRNMLTRQPPEGYAATCAAIRDADLRAAAATIRAPTLCLVGDQDRSTPPDLVRDTAALIPDARFETIADAGHIPCVEQPDALARALIDHLAEAEF